MLIGPDNFTRPPASQRQRWDAEVPLHRYEEKMPTWQRNLVWVGALGLCIMFWVGVLS